MKRQTPAGLQPKVHNDDDDDGVDDGDPLKVKVKAVYSS